MQLVNVSTLEVVTLDEFRALFPNYVFPSTPVQDNVSFLGYSIVQVPPMPATLNQFYSVTEGAPTQSGSVWTQTWVTAPIPLSQAQQSQSAAVSTGCALAITSGFSSSALGSVYTYPSSLIDQQNLSIAVNVSLTQASNPSWTTSFWCQNSSGVWAWTDHTAAQIQQVGNDWLTAKTALQKQNATLQAQIAAATTVDQVATYGWTLPSAS